MLLLVLSAPASAASFIVDNGGDGHDRNPGDGVCDGSPTGDPPFCTLRAAVEESNVLGSEDDIQFDVTEVQLTIAGGGAIEIATGEPLTIQGREAAHAQWHVLPVPQPEVSGPRMAGQVLRVDRFGNLVTNIDRKRFEVVPSGGATSRSPIDGRTVDRLVATYAEGARGRVVRAVWQHRPPGDCAQRGERSAPVWAWDGARACTSTGPECCSTLATASFINRRLPPWFPMINFDLTDEQRLLEQTVREWGAREIAPRIKELDRAHRFDKDILPQMAEFGLLGISVPVEYGGAGWTTSAWAWPAKSSNTSTRRCA